jgi:hypothetical protein
VLIDEWVTYARLQWGKDDLPGGTFDAALSFAQQLTGAVDQVPGALLVMSLPSSAIEVGGEGGQKTLESLKHVVHRVDAPWKPAAAQESFEIGRRRLFEPLTPEAMKDRDEVVQRFGELYAAHGGSFPAETKEKAYLDRIRACYPIHPELFDRLFDDWSTLERFQRTRGVLKLMAGVVHALWEKQDGNLLILPAAVPLDDTMVLPQLTQYLDDGWQPIIESDVDGTSSLPLRLDQENAGTYGRYSAARRVARTVFLGSAPLPSAANRGIDAKRILLGSVQPGEAPPTFENALNKLAGQATYLYENAGRYWYATQPSVNQLARDRAEQQATDRVEMEIERRLKAALADRGPFAWHLRRDPLGRPGQDEVALVALAPAYPHDPKASVSQAVLAASEILASRGAGARANQNMLVFLAPDSIRLAELAQAAREYLAWSSIVEDGEGGLLNLDSFQRSQAKTQRDAADQSARVRIPETYQWLLVPEQADPLAKVGLRPVKVSGGDALAVRAGAKLRNEELLITKFGGVNLRLVLDGALKEKWAAEGAFGLRQLWAWFAQYPYLPRLRDISVLEGAVRDGSSSLLWRRRRSPTPPPARLAGSTAASSPGGSGDAGDVHEPHRDGSVLPDPLPGRAEPAPTRDHRPVPAPPPPPRIRASTARLPLRSPPPPSPSSPRSSMGSSAGSPSRRTSASASRSTVEAEQRAPTASPTTRSARSPRTRRPSASRTSAGRRSRGRPGVTGNRAAELAAGPLDARSDRA